MSEKNPFELEQVAVRLVSAPPLYSKESMNSPEAAIRVMAKELKSYDREVVAVVNLNTKLQPINFSIASMGAIDSAIAHPREIMKNMFLSNAQSVILLHNHPSGNLIPSKEDIQITDQLSQLCAACGIQMLDHVIIAAGNEASYYSMKLHDQVSVNRIRFAQDIEAIKWPEPAAAETKAEYLQGKGCDPKESELKKETASVAENKPEGKYMQEDRPLTAADVTNIKCIESNYVPHRRTATHKLECEIRGEPDVLTYKVTLHDYGDGFNLHSEKDDIWNKMDRRELFKLEDVVSKAVTFHEWEESLEEAKTVREVRDVRYGLYDEDNLNLTKAQKEKLYDMIDEKEAALLNGPEKSPTKGEEKTSVLEKLQEKKEESSKVPVKAKEEKTKDKNVSL